MNELDLFIKSNKSFKDFIQIFKELFSLEMDIHEGEDRLMCVYYVSDIEIRLFDNHGMEDDVGIRFTEYDYCLSLIKLRRGGVSKEYEDLYQSLAKYYAAKISGITDTKCILVENLVRIIL